MSPLPFPAPGITDDVVTFYPIGTVAAGYNELAFEDYGTDPVDVPRRYLAGRPQSDYFVLTVHGDSMYPGYLDGDQVLVLKQNTVDSSGDIAVILYESDCATLKKVEFDVKGDWLRLVPTNPNYPPKTIEGADLEKCRILGVPRLLIRQFAQAASAPAKKTGRASVFDLLNKTAIASTAAYGGETLNKRMTEEEMKKTADLIKKRKLTGK